MHAVNYRVTILTQAGETLDLTQFLLSGSWSDSAGELAARASLTFGQELTEKGYVNHLLKLCTPVFLYADGAEVFRGVVWEWEDENGSARQTTVTAYDHMIYAQQSVEDSYYSAGLATRDIVGDICARWGIPLEYGWESHTHAKLKYAKRTVAEELLETLDEAARGRESKYTIYMSGGVLRVKPRGSNETVYYFTSENTVSARDKLSLKRLVTKILVTGKQDDAGRLPVEAALSGAAEYGTLQAVVRREGDTTLEEARAEAEELLRERGKPEETVAIKAPDIPAIRKGDRIRVNVGSLYETYLYVAGITHDIASGKMNMECEG